MSQEINNHLSLSSPLSLSFQRTRSKGPDCSDPPTLQLLATFLLSSFKIQGGGGCFSSNKEFLLWNSVESILNQYDTLNFHYEASNLKTRVKCNQLYTRICVFPGNKRTPWERPAFGVRYWPFYTKPSCRDVMTIYPGPCPFVMNFQESNEYTSHA